MKESIALLNKVLATMDTIHVQGIDNQDKFVGCAMSIQEVIVKMKLLAKQEEVKEVPENG